MAHNLNKTNGVWSFAAKGEKAWHGLGQYVDKAMTSEEAIRLGGLDYVVEKRPLYTKSSDDQLIEIPGFYSTTRVDTNDPLGIVTNRYTIVQNKDAFCFFDSIIDKGEAIFETAGALGKGERIFITAKLPDDMEVRGEKIEKYILLTNSHDGNSSIIAGFTPIRVVCNNTLQASLNNLSNQVKIPHVSSAESRLAEASRLMGIASKYMNQVNTIFEDMSKKRVSDVEIDEFIQSIFAPKHKENEEMSTKMLNILSDVKSFTLNHETQTTEAAYRTLWGLYNGVSGYYTHVKNYSSVEKRMNDLTYNGASNRIQDAFDKAITML
jgi:phage/plasmid-like protein (TIGR03299 family)